MDLREQLLRHRKDSRFIVGGLSILLILCGLVYYFLQRGKGLPAELATNKLLLFALWYVNIVLILTIIVILVRNLFRLLLERHNRILGSKFKTKLVLTAIGLSLIPVLILFPFSMRLLLDSFDQWFTLPVDDLVVQAADTAQALADQIENTNLRDARRVLEELAEFEVTDLEHRLDLQQRMEALRQEMQLHYLGIYDGVELIHGTADASAGFHRAVSFRGLNRFLERAIERGEATRIEDSLDIDGRLFLAASVRPRPAGDETTNGEPVDPAGVVDSAATEPTVVVVGTVLPPDVAAQSERLLEAHQTYLQLAIGKEDLRAFLLNLLILVTLLVVLAFSSIGLRLAKRVTAPIQALADGTRRISSGELDHRVVVAVDDELRVLVDAFNNMTEELQRNKVLVDRSNRELKDANKRLAAVLQNVAAGVIAIDAEGKILTCNGAALEILNQRAEEVIGRSTLDAWSDPERGKLVMVLDEEFTAGGRFVSQVRIVVGGVWKTLEVKVTTLPDPSGQPGGRVMVLEDLTELIHAQKMATWNEVARQIAHEIKNPLTPIRLAAERLRRRFKPGDPGFAKTLKEGTELIVNEVSSLKHMVDEFSRFARMPRPQPREVDLEKLAGEVLRLYRGLKPGVEIEEQIAPGAATVRFDPEQLRSVLINLLDNAVAATDSPGTIVLSTAQHNGSVLVRVADTGQGIPIEKRDKLFLPYYSTKGRGSGMGLAIVHRIVADHNASIHVGSNHPQGSVFTLEIPQL